MNNKRLNRRSKKHQQKHNKRKYNNHNNPLKYKEMPKIHSKVSLNNKQYNEIVN